MRAPTTFSRSPRRGLTMIEMLVCLAIVSILAGLMTTVIQKTRGSANRLKCVNNMKELGLALHSHHTLKGAFPAGANDYMGPDPCTQQDRRTWFVMIQPQFEQKKLHDQLESFMRNAPYTVYFSGNRTIMSLALCPLDPAGAKVRTGGSQNPGNEQGFHGNYVGCAGTTSFNPSGTNGGNLDGIFYAFSRTRIQDITDGLANTLLLSEIIVSPDVTYHDVRGRYYNPAHQGSVLFSTLYPPNTAVPDRLQYCQSIPKAPCSRATADIVLSARSYHSGTVNICLADGAVRSISNKISPTVWRSLGSRAGGEANLGY